MAKKGSARGYLTTYHEKKEAEAKAAEEAKSRGAFDAVAKEKKEAGAKEAAEAAAKAKADKDTNKVKEQSNKKGKLQNVKTPAPTVQSDRPLGWYRWDSSLVAKACWMTDSKNSRAFEQA